MSEEKQRDAQPLTRSPSNHEEPAESVSHGSTTVRTLGQYVVVIIAEPSASTLTSTWHASAKIRPMGVASPDTLIELFAVSHSKSEVIAVALDMATGWIDERAPSS